MSVCGDVRLGLVVVVVRDEVLDRVVRQQLAELVRQLCGQRLVRRHHQRRAAAPARSARPWSPTCRCRWRPAARRPARPLDAPGRGRRSRSAGRRTARTPRSPRRARRGAGGRSSVAWHHRKRRPPTTVFRSPGLPAPATNRAGRPGGSPSGPTARRRSSGRPARRGHRAVAATGAGAAPCTTRRRRAAVRRGTARVSDPPALQGGQHLDGRAERGAPPARPTTSGAGRRRSSPREPPAAAARPTAPGAPSQDDAGRAAATIRQPKSTLLELEHPTRTQAVLHAQRPGGEGHQRAATGRRRASRPAGSPSRTRRRCTVGGAAAGVWKTASTALMRSPGPGSSRRRGRGHGRAARTAWRRRPSAKPISQKAIGYQIIQK